MHVVGKDHFSTDLHTEVSVESTAGSKQALVIHNDDFNTFDFVIETLIEVCSHEPLQAEQCTYLIHYTGKCAVRLGSIEVLHPMWAELVQRGLTATIEQQVKIRA